jgi:hypothetical protein
MKALTFWLVRVALFLAVLLALWGLGWRSGTSLLGALAVTWFVSYALFGSLYDPVSEWLEGVASRRGKPDRS